MINKGRHSTFPLVINHILNQFLTLICNEENLGFTSLHRNAASIKPKASNFIRSAVEIVETTSLNTYLYHTLREVVR